MVKMSSFNRLWNAFKTKSDQLSVLHRRAMCNSEEEMRSVDYSSIKIAPPPQTIKVGKLRHKTFTDITNMTEMPILSF